MKKPLTAVTDHAIVRYFERVLGYDIDALRLEIGRRVDPGVKLGASGVIIEGFTYKIQDGQSGPLVSTILPHGMPTAEIRGLAKRVRDV